MTADPKKGSLSECLLVRNLRGWKTRHAREIPWHGDGAGGALSSIDSC